MIKSFRLIHVHRSIVVISTSRDMHRNTMYRSGAPRMRESLVSPGVTA